MKYSFKLFVSGKSLVSERAIKHIKAIKNNYMPDCNIEIIDITKIPEKAYEYRILATPTLIQEFPEPVARFIGDLSDLEKTWPLLKIKNHKI